MPSNHTSLPDINLDIHTDWDLIGPHFENLSGGVLRHALFSQFNVPITPALAHNLVNLCLSYELRDYHPDAFNSPLLAIHPAYFLPKDQQALFDVCGVDQLAFTHVVKHCHVVNTDFQVVSDPYNLFVVWMVHLFTISPLVKDKREEATTALLKLLQYKFFTSLINHYFPHKANEAIMMATLASLSLKFDIKQPETSTWRLIIESRARDVVDKESPHHATLATFTPDAKVFYVLSDIQTRLRVKLQLVVREYYKSKEHMQRIDSYGLTDDIDGEKVFKNIGTSFDRIADEMCNQSLNLNKFLDYETIATITLMNSNVRMDALKALLVQFSDMALHQYQKGDGDKQNRDKTLYLGYHILIFEFVQKTYRSCMLAGVDMKSKLHILDYVQNVYRSSRINDPDVLKIKDSVEHFVIENAHTSREATVSALKIGFVVYLILLSFKCM